MRTDLPRQEKGEKEGKSKGPKGPNFTKLKKEIVKLIKKVSADYRVLVIGCTSKPWDASLPDLKKMFESIFTSQRRTI